MKRIASMILLLGIGIHIGHAQNASCRINTDNFDMLQVTFTSGSLSAENITAFGQSFSTFQMDGTFFSQKVGEANLPTYSSLIEVPFCNGFAVTVDQAEYDTLDLAAIGANHPIFPLQPSRSKSDTAFHPLVWNKSAYETDAYLGADLVQTEKIGIARDRSLARLQISPIRYNAVQGKIIVCRQASITIRYIDADSNATLQMFQRYHSPAFHTGNTLNSIYPKSVANTAPVRYMIVAHSMFRGQLDDFVAWKQRKGFLTDIHYTDESQVGTTNASITSFIHSQYTNATQANPAPTYVLLVGDHEQIPAAAGTAAVSSTGYSHITDLYFMSWTAGDNIPDCYYGRFSAQSVSDLTPQIDKTLMYEQYTFADPSFLDRAVMVAGVDGGSSSDYGYTHADPAMDYAITNYVNGANGFSNVYYFKNNTSIVPSVTNLTVGTNASSNSATVRSYYNAGAGWINYSAHGSATSWGTPNFTTSHASSMTNTQKFGLMIGNCCLTNKFETTTCLGEAVLRKGNYCGAVGYIGGTNSTYWYEDFYWAVGLRASSSIGPSMSMTYNASARGNYDAFCHTHGEGHSAWVETQGGLVLNGNAIVQSGTSSSTMKLYYWEIYQLMGDPSVMPYQTQADTIVITAPSSLLCGTTTISVHAVPYAYIAITDTATHTLIDAAYADSLGNATLTLPATLIVGGYEIAASAQQYRTTFKPLNMIVVDGPYVVALMNNTPANAGTDTWLGGKVVNLGSQTATNAALQFSCDNPNVTLLSSALAFDSIPAGDTLTIDSMLSVRLDVLMPDMSSFVISTLTTWDSSTLQVSSTHTMFCHAPLPSISFTNLPQYVLPGDHLTLDIQVSNIGHDDITPAAMELYCPIGLIHITPADTSRIALAADSACLRQFTIDIDSTLPLNIAFPIEVRLNTPLNIENATAILPVGVPAIETFEGDSYHLTGWSQGTYPWAITNVVSQTGSYSARSNASLTHSQTSTITLTRTIGINDSISFYYKVSSEANYDKFHFYIDNTDMLTASGTVDWTRAAYPVEAGVHTFTFSYAKDYSVSYGSDCAWIDQVKLPQEVQSWRTVSDTLCYGQPYVVMGLPVNTQVPGTFQATDTTADTLAFITYTVLPQRLADTEVVACDLYEWNGTTYRESATFTDTLTFEGECPLYLNCHLTINHSTADTLTEIVCDSLTLWDQTFTLTGSYENTQTNEQGCDSIVTLHLTVHYSTLDTLVVTQDTAPYVFDHYVYNTSGTYIQSLETAEGCDSIIVIELTITGETEGISSIGASESLVCYPNPTSSSLHFSQPVQSAIIYDLMGRRVLSLARSDNANVGMLAKGIYTLEAVLQDGTISRHRIVISR